ncbi:fibronectin type III domain-containing protein [Coccidioides immitis RS]|uniref:Fibronectin type III domain-containing protein n=2 Tax=Coccidioides immitis TaxID=5501 RepID=J3KAX6_COCIM|nr:fibronectin type III domain-containing protein [Coccidioides immitis RS]EAS32218.3 fibronectin type III domain-containing protein [Coccidioides immitis RS]TPX19383.1 hypothetical protein DIZ76_017172 [Coccidioides immitis]
MYEPLRLVSDTYPGVVPGVKAQGVMALLIAVSILWALIWLSYRAYQVCVTPNDVLVDKLGLDIPPTPEVTLEDIGSREIRIAWKYPDLHNSIHKHVIQVNGVRVGESKRSETAVSILNLLPGHIYHLCVIAISAANFQTSSAVLHVRTSLDPSQNEGTGACGGPYIQAYSPRPSSLVSPSAPIMSREHSSGPAQAKRASGGRKVAASTSVPEHTSSNTPCDDGKGTIIEDSEETVEQLAGRLKNLQQENDTLDKQICQEEKEYESLLRELEDQRNELRQRVKEKDEASGDLRKHVNKLESVNRSVQSERSKRERLLQQKEAEKKKRSDDVVRWDEGISEMRKMLETLQNEKAQIEDESEKRIAEYRTKISQEQVEMKSLEDDIKVKGSRIKMLEEERRLLEGGDNEETQELDRLERERDRRWEVKMANLRAQYTSLINVHTQAQQQYYEAQERLKWITTQRSNSAVPYAPVPTMELDLARRANSYRRNRHRSSLTSNVSSPLGYPVADTTFQNPSGYRQLGTASPTVPPTSAFFNINNGMTIPDPTDQMSSVRTEPSNPPMSPRADALLPSDLLGDEDQSPRSPQESTEFPTLPVSAAPFQGLLPTSPSPVSGGSHPPSLFASPRESLVNLPESERKPTQPPVSHAPSDAAQSASRKLSGLFTFNRQRGKTMADGPLLGSLKPGQSQSFPRNMDQDFDPIGTRRRRLSYTGSWANPMATLFPRSSTAVTADSSSDRVPASRKAMIPSFFTTGKFSSTLGKSESSSGYNQFSPTHDPIDPSIFGAVRRDSLSPRPASTYSFDKFLPRPNSDAQPFGWPPSEMHRNSPLNVDWSTPGGAWSRSQSRRPSFQLGSSNHLPLTMPPSDMDFLEAPYEPQRPVQAPIGTRPSSSHRPMTPKLNPAAPSFKTLFNKKSEKSKGKDPDTSKGRDEPQLEDTSPVESRRSKDARSIRTSAAESHESLERISSGAPSEAISTKESFIQKITRKGSSSKFNMPWKDRASLFSKRGDSATQVDVEDDGTSEIQLGKSIDSAVSSTPSVEKSSKSGFNLSFRRKLKKSERATGESSERASENGDDDVFEDV